MIEQDKIKQFEILKERLPYNEEEFSSNSQYEKILNQLLDDAENIALSDLYPFDNWSEKELPKKLYNWQIRACVELSNYLGKEGLISYSENGLSFSRKKEGLSSDLQNEIMPNVGVISPNNNLGGE